MTSRSERDYRECPPKYGPDWPNNGEVNERLRCGLLLGADKAEEAGDAQTAEYLRGCAAIQLRERDRCYRDHERCMLGRHTAAERLRHRHAAG
jgi:hypothetical protein